MIFGRHTRSAGGFSECNRLVYWCKHMIKCISDAGKQAPCSRWTDFSVCCQSIKVYMFQALWRDTVAQQRGAEWEQHIVFVHEQIIHVSGFASVSISSLCDACTKWSCVICFNLNWRKLLYILYKIKSIYLMKSLII